MPCRLFGGFVRQIVFPTHSPNNISCQCHKPHTAGTSELQGTYCKCGNRIETLVSFISPQQPHPIYLSAEDQCHCVAWLAIHHQPSEGSCAILGNRGVAKDAVRHRVIVPIGARLKCAVHGGRGVVRFIPSTQIRKSCHHCKLLASIACCALHMSQHLA